MSNDELQKAIDDITSGDENSTGSVDVPAGDMAPVFPTNDVSGQNKENEDLFGGLVPAPEVNDGSFGIPIMPPDDDKNSAPAVTKNTGVRNSKVAQILTGFGRKDDMTSEGTNNVVGTNVPMPAVNSGMNTPGVMKQAMSEQPVMDAGMSEKPVVPVEKVVSEAPGSVAANDIPEVKMPELTEEGPKDPELKEVETAALLELYPLLGKMKVNPQEKFEICMKVLEKTGEKDATSAALAAAKEISDEVERGKCLIRLIELIGKM